MPYKQLRWIGFLFFSALATHSFAQFETAATNTGDNATWSGSIDWDSPFGSTTANTPGSNAGGSASDDVIFSHHEGITGTQTYRLSSDVGTISTLQINGGTPGVNVDHVKLQIRSGANLNVTGATTLGEHEQASIDVQQNSATVALRGDINIFAGVTGNSRNSFIEQNANSSTLIIGGNINGYVGASPTGGGIDLRINSSNAAGVVYNTTGGSTTDTNAQTFTLDEFGVGNSGLDGITAVHTLGQGKTVNAEDLNVGVNFATSVNDRTVTGNLTIENTTLTASDDAFIGRNSSSNSLTAQTRVSEGTVNVNNGGTLAIGDQLIMGNGTGQSSAANQSATGTLNVNNGGAVTVGGQANIGADNFGSGTVNVNSGGVFSTATGNLNIGGAFSNTNAGEGTVGELNVASGGAVTVGNGVAEEHLFIGRDGRGTVNSAGSITVTNGDIRLGDSTVATGQSNTFTMTAGTTSAEELLAGFTAGNNGTVNVSGGTLSLSENAQIGGNSDSGDQNSTGQLNVSGTGTVIVGNGGNSDRLWIARGGTGDVTVDGAGASLTVSSDVFLGASTAQATTGTLTIDNGATVVVGRQIVAGRTSLGTGVVNVNDGSLSTNQEIYLGGDNVDSTDSGSSGTLNIGSAGTVTINANGGATENLEVGRDGSGFLNVNGGTLQLHTGNLVLGQTNTAGSSGITQFNDARGTVTIQNGATVNIGDLHVDGANTDNENSNLNFNAGGGDITHSGSGTVLRVEQDLNMQSVGTVAAASVANASSSYTISDTSILVVSNDFNARTNVAGKNTLEIIGGSTDISIGNDFDVNESSFELVFDFDNASDSIFDFNFDVAGNAELGGATLTFQNSGDLATFAGDILLIDVAGNSGFGEFTNAAEGTAFGAYQLTYNYADSGGTQGAGVDQGMIGGGQSIALIRATAVPEPSSLIVIALAGLAAARRRRKAIALKSAV